MSHQQLMRILLGAAALAFGCGDDGDRTPTDGAADGGGPAIEWVSAGSLSSPHYAAQAAVLGDEVLLFGNTSVAGRLLSRWTIDGDWTETASIPARTDQPALAMMGSTLLAAGGGTMGPGLRPSGVSETAYSFSSFAVGEDLPSMPAGRSMARAVTTSEGTLVLGGLMEGAVGRGTYRDTVVFASGAWAVGPDLPEGRIGHAVHQLDDGRPMVVGGHRLPPVLDGSLVRGEPLTGSTVLEAGEWVVSRDMSVGRGFFGSGVLGSGRLIVAGGLSDDAEATAVVEVYDPEMDAWARAADLPQPLAFTASLVIDGDLWLFGGTSEVRAADGPGFPREMRGSSLVVRYDEAADRWTEMSPLPTPRYAHAAALLPDGRVLIAGGLEFADTSDVGYVLAASVTAEPVR